MVEFQSGEKGSWGFIIFPGQDPLQKSEEEGLPITLYLQENKKTQ